MAQQTQRGRIALTGGTVAVGAQLLAAQSGSAHTGPHGDEAAQSDRPVTDEHHDLASESPPAEVSSNFDKADSNRTRTPMRSAKVKDSGGDETPGQKVTVTQASPATAATKASLPDGFSIGLGESLFGLVIAGPFLLASLKKQLQS